MVKASQNLQGIAWMVLTGFLIVSIYTIVRYLSPDFHPFQLVFFYDSIGLAMYLPFILRKHLNVKTERTRLYLLRAVLEFCGFSLSFYGLRLLPLPVHTALSFTSPLFGAIAAVILLREPNHSHRWIALLMGFAGVLVITRPGLTDFAGGGIVMVGAATCFSICMICIKKLTRTEPSARIAFYMLGFTSLISLPFAVSVWQWPELRHLPYLLLLGILVAMVQFSVSQAFSKTHVTVVTPFFYINLLWSSMYAYLVFNEVVSVWTLAGGAIILMATFYATHHARRIAKNPLTQIHATSAEPSPLGFVSK